MKKNVEFNNGNGEKKQIARNLMVDAVKNSTTKNGLILSLPFETCIIEKMILNLVSKKIRFIGCEIVDKVFLRMLDTIRKENLHINPWRGALSEKIYEARKNQYSHIIADYCGQLNSFHKELQFAMENDIVETDGTICVTLNKRITKGCFGIVELMEKLNPNPNLGKKDYDMTRTEHALRTFVNRVGGLRYAIESVLNYQDTAPMILVIIRRIA